MKKIIISAILAAVILCGCSTSSDPASSALSDTSGAASAVSAASDASSAASSESAASEAAPAASSSGAEEASSGASDASSEAAPDESSQAASAAEETSSAAETAEDEDVYAGTYVEEVAGRGVITITNAGGNVYNVSVSWPSSAFETSYWEMSGEFNGRAVLNYDNCKKTTVTYAEDGSSTEEIVYENGTGYLQMADRDADTITVNWSDDKEDAANGSVFVKQ